MRCVKIREYSKGGGREAILPFDSSLPGILIVPLVWRSLLILFFVFCFFVLNLIWISIMKLVENIFFSLTDGVCWLECTQKDCSILKYREEVCFLFSFHLPSVIMWVCVSKSATVNCVCLFEWVRRPVIVSLLSLLTGWGGEDSILSLNYSLCKHAENKGQ